MEVELDLDGHCIETAAKKKYNKLVKELLRIENREKERELELLLDFLTNANFSELRKAGFDGNRRTKVRVRKIDGEFVVEEI